MTLLDIFIENEKLRKEWAADLNTDVPSSLLGASNKKVWWRCSKGHEWQTRVCARTIDGHDCPYCSGRAPIPGETDLATLHSELAKEWHPTLNGDLKPSDVKPRSGKKVWWRCDKGHEWQATLASRVCMESNCAVCANIKIVPGINDLATLSPEVAAQWHPKLNGKLTPEMVGKGSAKKVWWRCEKGHEWQATVGSRARDGTGCPCCAGLRVIPGETDLVTLRPDIAEQWDYERNGDISPQKVSVSSHKKAWWLCGKGHGWQAPVYIRTNQGSGCPYCSGRKQIPGETDLTTLKPELAKEWHPTLNGDLKPSDVGIGSREKVWWMCKKGHSWQAQVNVRSSSGSGCPYCSGLKPAQGKNDLSTLEPELAKEWHPTLNGDLKPSDVGLGSKRKVWWRCDKGHEWQTQVLVRASQGSGCPYCAGRKPIPGVNDFATLYPELAKEWHPTLNGDLKPSDVGPGSSKKVWWRCDKGHEWQAIVQNRRVGGRACPTCNPRRKPANPPKTIIYGDSSALEPNRATPNTP